VRVTRESRAVTAIAAALEPFVDAGEIAGLVALVARGDDVEVTVLGDQAIGGSPMRGDSLFRVASAGKPVTAAAALALVADGRLTLDQPVDELLPELAPRRVLREPSAALDDTVPAVRPVTVRDLLRSTSGLGFSSDFTAPITAALFERLNQGPPSPQDFAPPDQWIARAGELPLVHQPGEGFTYNTAYDILGVLIARASGRSFDDYLAERILGPLGMVDTGFSVAPGETARTTTAYRRADEGGLVVVDEPDGQFARPPVFASGAGGYVSTAADLLRFQRMLLAGGGDVLPGRWVAEMMTDQLSPALRATDSVFLNGQSWGYGGGVDIERREPWQVIGRYGWVGGTGTCAYVVPSDGSISILLTQTALGGAGGSPFLETFWAAAAAHHGHDH
jgi:CubicO group peptidase (beta-lactamase class C family)